MTTINPYLNFNGNTEEVFHFYQSVFGGEFLSVNRYKEVHSAEELGAGEGEKIMHISLPIGNGSILMGSDTIERRGKTSAGDNFSISITPDSQEEATRLFNGLSAGGQVTMPLMQAPWGAYFGMFTDKYGIQWMVNYEKHSQQ
ncbi:MAG: VOC family protein [Caldilineaceae bacterium]|nr:VOC family protein [Caldilineaceae bacterium]